MGLEDEGNYTLEAVNTIGTGTVDIEVVVIGKQGLDLCVRCVVVWLLYMYDSSVCYLIIHCTCTIIIALFVCSQ